MNGVFSETSLQLISYMEEYVRSGPSILVDGLLAQVDSTCAVSIESINDPQCIAKSFKNTNAVIIGVTIAGLVMVTIFLLCCICVLCVINLRRKWHLLTQKLFKSG